MTHETLYYLALQKIPQLGAINLKNLLEKLGSPLPLFSLKKRDLIDLGIHSKTKGIELLKAKNYLAEAEKDLKYIQKHGIECLGLLESGFPKRLKHCPDAPILLFFKGNFKFNNQRFISIVGTRLPTAYGKFLTQEFISNLPKDNLCIMSGLAYGIDALVHNLAYDLGIASVGVLGHGMHMIYPPENTKIAQKLQEHGGIMTEFKLGTEPDKFNFPKRNRIVAGISEATIVIETAAKGGSMITAELANDYNRDVFTFPGRVNDPKSEGCLKLIFENKAMLITNTKQFLEIMNWQSTTKKTKIIQAELFTEFNDNEKNILKILNEKGILEVDELLHLCQMSSSKLSEIILELELKGIIKWLPGKRLEVN